MNQRANSASAVGCLNLGKMAGYGQDHNGEGVASQPLDQTALGVKRGGAACSELRPLIRCWRYLPN